MPATDLQQPLITSPEPALPDLYVPIQQQVEQKNPAPDERKIRSHLLEMGFPDFQKGDILFYLPHDGYIPKTQQIISFFQSLTKRRHGHYEITHTGICVDVNVDEHGEMIPMIADVTGKGFRIGKIKKSQPMLVFRSKDPDIANSLAEQALEVKRQNVPIQWNLGVAIGLFFKRRELDPTRPVGEEKNAVSEQTVCSKFVCEVLGNALHGHPGKQRAYQVNVNADSTPKDLEAEFYKNDNYQVFSYLGVNGHLGNRFQYIQEVVEQQLKRLSTQTTDKGKAKYAAAQEAYDSAKKELEGLENIGDLEKAVFLKDWMVDTFSINTGNGWKTTSMIALNQAARNIHLFESVIQKYRKGLNVVQVPTVGGPEPESAQNEYNIFALHR
jgi:hypothetical protein